MASTDVAVGVNARNAATLYSQNQDTSHGTKDARLLFETMAPASLSHVVQLENGYEIP